MNKLAEKNKYYFIKNVNTFVEEGNIILFVLFKRYLR